jgi:hypothetical protein
VSALGLALLVAIVPSLGSASSSPAARLQEIRRAFPTRAKAISVAALEQLAHDAPHDQAGGRAMLWLGDLSLQEGRLDRAREFYRGAEPFSDELHRLALRGEGDVAMREHHYIDAREHYAAALTGAPPILAAELTQKVALAIRLHRRALAALFSLGLYVLVLGWFAWRIRRPGESLRPPLDALYVLPVYALLIVGCLHRDPQVLRALELGALGSLALIFASGLAARRAPTRPLLHALALIAANLALFYFVVWRAGIIDLILTTLQMAAPS